MKALTLHQPWASLVALGVKTIETRSWSTKHRGPIAIHAGQDTSALRWLAGLDWEDSPDPSSVVLRDATSKLGSWTDLPLGAIVATATLVDVVIIGRCHDPYAPEVPEFALAVAWSEDKAWHVVGDTAADVTDQLPFGDYSPGRYAWLLDDIQPTTERCPICLGSGSDPADTGWQHNGITEPGSIAECPACLGAGHCDPVPAKGRQGLWNWTPEAAR